MRTHRYYVEQPLGEDVVLQTSVSKHESSAVKNLIHQWISVLRYSIGDTVSLFNGDGKEHTYEIVTLHKNEVSLRHIKSIDGVIPKQDSYLVVSCIKKDLFELIVQKATECGVTHIIPVISEYTQRTHLDFERLNKLAREASEQSGRVTLPHIFAITPLHEALVLVAEARVSPKRTFIASLYGKPLRTILSTTVSSSPQNTNSAFVIGPEGGWSPEEELFFKKTYNESIVSLGKTVLRAETAATVASYLMTIMSE